MSTSRLLFAEEVGFGMDEMIERSGNTNNRPPIFHFQHIQNQHVPRILTTTGALEIIAMEGPASHRRGFESMKSSKKK